jgi:hypothetical protein
MNRLKPVVTIAIGTFILMLIGFYNGYPLVYSDTGTYLYSGFDKFVPMDRPIFYGLFVCLISLKYSLWPVILVQDLITAYVLYELLLCLRPGEAIDWLYIKIIFLLTFVTGIAWYSNQIMPDFFTPLSALTLFILLRAGRLPVWRIILLSCIFLLSLVSHFSHVLIAAILLCLIGITGVWPSLRRFRIWLRAGRIWLAAALVVMAWLLLPLSNYLDNGHFVVSRGSHVFYMSHLADTGILEKLLKENCGNPELKDCKLCAMKDSLARDAASFVWSGKFLKNMNDWETSQHEYDKIIRFSIRHPHYLAMTIYKDVVYSFEQLTSNEIGSGLSPYTDGSAPYGQISWRFPYELNNYLNDRQNKFNGAELSFDLINHANMILMIGCLFFIFYLGYSGRYAEIGPELKIFLIFAIAAIIANAVITASLTNPYNRYEARISWLLPLAVALIASEVNWKKITNGNIV